MADFCTQCSVDLGAPPGYSDLKFVGNTEALQLCEGCGWIMVDENGRCLGNCMEKEQHGRLTPEADLGSCSRGVGIESETDTNHEGLIAKLQFLIDLLDRYADKQGLLDDHQFTFPDGETWKATEWEMTNV